MRILTLVHTWTPYKESRAKLIEETWAKILKDFYFICVSKKFDLSRKINLGPYPQGPTYHPETVMRIFKLFLSSRFQHFDWLFIVDDDTYCFPGKLKLFLETYDSKTSLMLGDFLNWPRHHPELAPHYFSWVGGGAGIVFSRPAVNDLLRRARKNKLRVFLVKVWAAQGKLRSKLSRARRPPGPPRGPVEPFFALPAIVGGDTVKLNPSRKLWKTVMDLLHFVSSVVVRARYLRDNLRERPFLNHDVWLSELVTEDGCQVERVHAPGFHQYGQRALASFKLESDLLISVHLQGNLELMHRIHNKEHGLGSNAGQFQPL